MPVLGDFTLILGDPGQTIHVGNPAFLPRFGTGGRRSDEPAFLIYSVINMTGTADVVINNHTVGTITASPPGVFATQMIALPGNQLNDGNNEIVIQNVTQTFFIKDLFCFFHQSS